METFLTDSLWSACLAQLETELTARQLDTWIKPLQVESSDNSLTLLAPNRHSQCPVMPETVNLITRASPGQPRRNTVWQHSLNPLALETRRFAQS